jgi:hypothetical protein
MRPIIESAQEQCMCETLGLNDLDHKVKLSLCLTKHHAMKKYWGVEVFLISALDGGQLHTPAALPPGKESLIPVG